MSSASTAGRAGESLPVESEQWHKCLESLLSINPVEAEYFARLLFALLKSLESGSEGITQASAALRSGIEAAYLYTEAHKAALELYLLSLEGNLKPQDEPVRLLRAAIARGSVKG